MPLSEYSLLKELGRGSFGCALLAKRRADGEMCVIKQVEIGRMSSEERREAEKEAGLLAKMRHPNIIAFHCSFIEAQERLVSSPQRSGGHLLCIVMEYADGGDLTQFLEKRRGSRLPESQVIGLLVQICLAIKHLHDRKVLHRDLKPQNIFLTKRGVVKLGDLGVAKVLQGTLQLAHTQIGTPYYMSPEIFDGRPYRDKSDMWSLGCILFELLTLKVAFQAPNMKALMMRVSSARHHPLPATVNPDLASITRQLLARQPSKRPSVNRVLRHPAIQRRLGEFLDDGSADRLLHGGKNGVSPSRVPSKETRSPDAHREARLGRGVLPRQRLSPPSEDVVKRRVRETAMKKREAERRHKAAQRAAEASERYAAALQRRRDRNTARSPPQPRASVAPPKGVNIGGARARDLQSDGNDRQNRLHPRSEASKNDAEESSSSEEDPTPTRLGQAPVVDWLSRPAAALPDPSQAPAAAAAAANTPPPPPPSGVDVRGVRPAPTASPAPVQPSGERNEPQDPVAPAPPTQEHTSPAPEDRAAPRRDLRRGAVSPRRGAVGTSMEWLGKLESQMAQVQKSVQELGKRAGTPKHHAWQEDQASPGPDEVNVEQLESGRPGSPPLATPGPSPLRREMEVPTGPEDEEPGADSPTPVQEALPPQQTPPLVLPPAPPSLEEEEEASLAQGRFGPEGSPPLPAMPEAPQSARKIRRSTESAGFAQFRRQRREAMRDGTSPGPAAPSIAAPAASPGLVRDEESHSSHPSEVPESPGGGAFRDVASKQERRRPARSAGTPETGAPRAKPRQAPGSTGRHLGVEPQVELKGQRKGGGKTAAGQPALRPKAAPKTPEEKRHELREFLKQRRREVRERVHSPGPVAHAAAPPGEAASSTPAEDGPGVVVVAGSRPLSGHRALAQEVAYQLAEERAREAEAKKEEKRRQAEARERCCELEAQDMAGPIPLSKREVRRPLPPFVGGAPVELQARAGHDGDPHTPHVALGQTSPALPAVDAESQPRPVEGEGATHGDGSGLAGDGPQGEGGPELYSQGTLADQGEEPPSAQNSAEGATQPVQENPWEETPIGGGWFEAWDEYYNHVYYYHPVRDVSQWEYPDDAGTGPALWDEAGGGANEEASSWDPGDEKHEPADLGVAQGYMTMDEVIVWDAHPVAPAQELLPGADRERGTPPTVLDHDVRGAKGSESVPDEGLAAPCTQERAAELAEAERQLLALQAQVARLRLQVHQDEGRGVDPAFSNPMPGREDSSPPNETEEEATGYESGKEYGKEEHDHEVLQVLKAMQDTLRDVSDGDDDASTTDACSDEDKADLEEGADEDRAPYSHRDTVDTPAASASPGPANWWPSTRTTGVAQGPELGGPLPVQSSAPEDERPQGLCARAESGLHGGVPVPGQAASAREGARDILGRLIAADQPEDRKLPEAATRPPPWVEWERERG